MQNGLTDNDRETITKFLSIPKYERAPEMLIPDDEDPTTKTDGLQRDHETRSD